MFLPFFTKQNSRAFAKLVLDHKPQARASIKGSRKFPALHGAVEFYGADGGTLVVAELYKLPEKADGKPLTGPFAFHIHEGNRCSGNAEDPFADAGPHYNPTSQPHPLHAGDMPPLFSNHGYAYLSFFTDRFQPKDVIGHTVIVHEGPDDFRTQPAGNAGAKIGCGIIAGYR